ncbi:MAG: PAS domain-containing protein, partial [Bacteroidota bacterium]
MKKNKSNSGASSLRQKAEELLKIKSVNTSPPPSEADTFKLLYELEVHQIELELQNQELMEARVIATETAEKYSDLYEFAPIGYFSLSREGKIIEMNLTGSIILGKDREYLIHQPFQSFISYERINIFNHFYKKLVNSETRESCEVIITSQNHSQKNVIIYGNVGQNKALYHLTVVDITERKLLESQLIQSKEKAEESEKEFRLLAEAMPQIVWSTDADGLNTFFNQQWADYTGLTLEESYGHGWNIPFHPDDQQRAWATWKNAVNNNDTYSLECRLRRADGVYRWWLIRGVPVIRHDGQIERWFGTCTDIHDIKQSEATLKKSEERYRNLLLNLDAGIVVH